MPSILLLYVEILLFSNKVRIIGRETILLSQTFPATIETLKLTDKSSSLLCPAFGGFPKSEEQCYCYDHYLKY